MKRYDCRSIEWRWYVSLDVSDDDELVMVGLVVMVAVMVVVVMMLMMVKVTTTMAIMMMKKTKRSPSEVLRAARLCTFDCSSCSLVCMYTFPLFFPLFLCVAAIET